VNPPGRRTGLTLIEVLVILAVVAVVAFLVVMAVPVVRETARATACQRNLRDIGTAVFLYDNAVKHLPSVPGPGQEGDTPLAAMLGQLGVAHFGGLSRDKSQARGLKPGPVPEPHRIPEFVCPSDRAARDRDMPAPASYRACSGGDPQGRDGAFPLGGTVSLSEVQDQDGTGYTAAFAERLIGNGRDEPALSNYAEVGSLFVIKTPPSQAWRGDAGSDWSKPGWVSSVYNHALSPGGSPTLVLQNGRAALLSGSSAHKGRVHVLRLDGSLLSVTPSIDREIWRKMATIGDSTNPEDQEKQED
jgi:type II secretory pathway pseudopilin PulG